MVLAGQLKAQGNTSFTSKPPNHDAAVKAYRSALDILPPCPKKELKEKPQPVVPPIADGQSGLQEVTEEEAIAIEAESQKDKNGEMQKISERETVEEEVRELSKACWGNLAACYVALVSSSLLTGSQAHDQNEDKKAVEACTEGKLSFEDLPSRSTDATGQRSRLTLITSKL